MQQIEQPLASRRRNPTNDSSQILDGLLDQIMDYEAKYDAKLEIFYQALLDRIDAKYEERKEEEPSPPQYIQLANNMKSVRTQSDNITLNGDAKAFHPVINHNELDTIIEEDEDSDAEEVVDHSLVLQLEAMAKATLKDIENEKKEAKELADKLDKDEQEEINENTSLSPSPSSPSAPSSPSLPSLISSPSSLSTCVSPTNSISSSLAASVINITNINNNNPFSPYIIPNIYALPPLTTNIINNCVTKPNLNNPSCLIMPIPSPPINPLFPIPVISNQSSSFQNKQYEQESNTDCGPTKNGVYTQCMQNNCFRPKFNNHAKGNFYISKDMISRMVLQCIEVFDTDHVNDEKLAFGYYKESVAMQINDGQINDIIMTKLGLIIIINIDLHFKDGEIMYLVANENNPEYREKVRWCITDFMRAHEIYNKYGVSSDQLPLSSRNMYHFQKAINMPPTNVSSKIVKYTNFRDLPRKTSKRQSNGFRPHRTEISEYDLKYYCSKNWNKSPVIPVVVIKGKKQWVEWKKFIEIYDEYNNSQPLWIGISLKYYSSNKQWKIECMDYDAGRIYYQHRLVGNNKYTMKYNQLSKYITTELDIY